MLHAGRGELFCCGQPMQLLVADTIDASYEKHVPVVEKVANGFLVKVGSDPHPMIPEHYIEWIDLVTENGICRRFLEPGDVPEILFEVVADSAKAKAYCNLHDLWESK